MTNLERCKQDQLTARFARNFKDAATVGFFLLLIMLTMAVFWSIFSERISADGAHIFMMVILYSVLAFFAIAFLKK